MPQLYLPQFTLTEPTRNQKDKNKCQQCQQQFGFTKREHLCKRCFRFVCDACSPHKEKVYKANMLHRAHRLCNSCYTQSQILRKYVEVNKISWAEDSDMGRLWIKQIGQKKQLELKRKTDFKKRRQEFDATSQQLWGSLNYSFRELIGRAIDKSQRLRQQAEQHSKKQKERSIFLHNKVTEQVLELLSILMSQVNQQKVEIQNIVFILIFFLIHSSPQNAIILTRSALQIMNQKEISIEGVCFYLKKLVLDQDECCKIQNYLDSHLEKITRQMSINYFSIQISIEIISVICSKKNFKQLEKAIAYILSKRKQYILANCTKAELIEIDLLRNHQGLGQGFKKFTKLCQNSQSLTKIKNNQPSPKKQNSVVQPKQLTYDDLVRQNEQLKLKNKNQFEEITRIKKQNNQLCQNNKKLQKALKTKSKQAQKQWPLEQQQRQNDIDSIESYESYWQEVQQQSNGLINAQGMTEYSDNSSQKLSQRIRKLAEAGLHPQFKQFDKYKQVVGEFATKSKDGTKKQKKKKLVKKYRPKQNHTRLNRMTTMSQKLAKQIQQFNKNNESQSSQQLKLKYEQIVRNKNQQITILQKQLQIQKYTSKLREQELTKQPEPAVKQVIAPIVPVENEKDIKVKQQLEKMQEMNKKLLLKIKQLSNLLMDKEEEQVKQSEQSLEELVQVYEEQTKDPNQQCRIF